MLLPVFGQLPETMGGSDEGAEMFSLVTHKRERNQDCLFLVAVQSKQNTFTFSVQERLGCPPNGCTTELDAEDGRHKRRWLDLCWTLKEDGCSCCQASSFHFRPGSALEVALQDGFCIVAAAGVFGGDRGRLSSWALVLVEAVNTCIRLWLV